MRSPVAFLLAAAVLAPIGPGAFLPKAAAQQPLPVFLRAAQERSLDVRQAAAALERARSQAAEARARFLPALTGQGAYQRNAPAVVIAVPTGMTDAMGAPVTRQATITPADQFAALATMTVPIVDLSAWANAASAGANADAERENQDFVQENVSIAVAQLWNGLVAQRALAEAAQKNVDATQHSRDSISAQVEVGVAGQLELARAEAELARARQALAQARLQATLTARDLADLSGVIPDETKATLEATPGEPPPPLQGVSQTLHDLPAVRTARARERAADLAENAAWRALFPVLAANAAARWTNAAGFGHKDSYYAGLSATWTLDFLKPARIGTTRAELGAAEVQSERAAQQAATALFDAWHRVQASRTSVEAALAGQQASQRAAHDAQARYESGTATQLDLIEAQRDAFQADVAVIQAAANLNVARAELDVRRGLPLR